MRESSDNSGKSFGDAPLKYTIVPIWVWRSRRLHHLRSSDCRLSVGTNGGIHWFPDALYARRK